MAELEDILKAYEEKEKNRIQLKPLADFEQKEAEWLIAGYIPKNQITIIGGDGGTGKTSLWCNLVASLSNGTKSLLEHALPFESEPEPKKVIFFSSEDSIVYVLKDRLSRYNADMNNIYSISLEDRNFSNIRFNSEELEDILATYRPDLVIFDPLQSFLPNGVQMSSRNQMRDALNPLIALGQRYSTTFIVIMHTNKRKGVWGRNRLADSADTWDIARSVLIVGKDKEENRYVSQEKNNYGATSDSIIFTLNDGIAEFKSCSPKHDKDFVSENDYEQQTQPKVEDAKAYILSYLANCEDGKCQVSELEKEMHSLNYSDYSIRNAKTSLKNEGKIARTNEGYGKDKAHYMQLKGKSLK